MKYLILISILLFTGCKEEPAPCPKQLYPTLEAIDKLPRYTLTVRDGSLDAENTKKAFKLLKAHRVSENYYYELLARYRKEFL